MKTLSIVCGSVLIFCALIVLPSCGFIAINSNFHHTPGISKQAVKTVKKVIKAKTPKQIKKPFKRPIKACQCPINKTINITIK